jgi:hypothetical protein
MWSEASEERATSIFRVENQPIKIPACSWRVATRACGQHGAAVRTSNPAWLYVCCFTSHDPEGGGRGKIVNSDLSPDTGSYRIMVSSGMLRRVGLVRTDVSEELSASFITVTRIGELEILRTVRRLLVTASPSSPILVTLMKEALSSSDASVLTRATRRNIPENGILHSHRRENLKSYTGSYCRFWGKISGLLPEHGRT